MFRGKSRRRGVPYLNRCIAKTDHAVRHSNVSNDSLFPVSQLMKFLGVKRKEIDAFREQNSSRSSLIGRRQTCGHKQ